MKDKLLANNTSALERQGMNWVDSELKWVSQTWQLPFLDSRWEFIQDSAEKSIWLIIVGPKEKRAMKLFTRWELENCQNECKLQEDLQMRLLRMLSFVTPARDKRANEL